MLSHSIAIPDCKTIQLVAGSFSSCEGFFLQTKGNNPSLIYLYQPEQNTQKTLSQLLLGIQEQQLNALLLPIDRNNAKTEDKEIPFHDWLNNSLIMIKKSVEFCASATGSVQVILAGSGVGSWLAIQVVHQKIVEVNGLILDDGIPHINMLLTMLLYDNSSEYYDSKNISNPLEAIGNITLPTLFFHGAADNLVSIQEAEQFQAVSGARKKQFYVIPGAQRGRLAETGGTIYFETVRRFVDEVCGRNSWRERRRKYRQKRGNS